MKKGNTIYSVPSWTVFGRSV